MTRRVTDAERSAVGQMLSDAVLNGMLRQDEWEQRNAVLLGVHTEEELRALYADLTGSQLPLLMLSVDKTWFGRASRVKGNLNDLTVCAKWVFYAWVAMPFVLFFVGNAVAGTDSSGTGWQVVCFYFAMVAVATLTCLIWVTRVAARAKRLLDDARIE